MDTKQVIVVRKDLNMRKGKLAAQVAHAAMTFLIDSDIDRAVNKRGYFAVTPSEEELAWLTDPESAHAKVVVGIDSERELTDLCEKAEAEGMTVHKVIDAGRTEFNGVPTLTCAAFGPHRAERFQGVTDHLKLL